MILMENLIETLSSENYYLVLASHTPVEPWIQEKCDFYIHQSLNIVDDRKYSHGVAENNLIKLALDHLDSIGINWTYKVSYDVVIEDVSRFKDRKRDFAFDFVSCIWGNNIICTNSFFARVKFILENINFYDSIESMFRVNSVLENCWEYDIRSKGLESKIYSYPSKNDFFGEKNKIDNLFYNYNSVDFWYSFEDLKFYFLNNGPAFSAEIRIFDYYTDICIYKLNERTHESGVTIWILPPDPQKVAESKNGFYLEVYLDNGTVIRKNILINDFNLKHPLHKKFKHFKRRDIKYLELRDFDDYKYHKEAGIDVENVKNFLDIGACYGLSSTPFIVNEIKTYMVEADPNNVEILKNNFGYTSEIKIIDKAIYKEDGLIDFYVQEDDHSVVSSLDPLDVTGNGNGRKKIRVHSIHPDTLFSMIEEDEIDLIKMDIQGAEYSFFDKISDDQLKRAKRIHIEFYKNEDLRVFNIIKKLVKNEFKFKLHKMGNHENPDVLNNTTGIIYAYR